MIINPLHKMCIVFIDNKLYYGTIYSTYYASIVLDASSNPLYLKLSQHNRLMPIANDNAMFIV